MILEALDWTDAGRILAAAAAGALIGLEREVHDKPAGLRTNILIAIGAAMFTIISIRSADATSDSTRISAQIVSGVGFLGAGAILRSGIHVIGLTTAATIWTVASLGMAFGAGFYFIGVIGTLLVHGVLLGLVRLEPMIDRWRSFARFELRVPSTADAESLRTLLLSNSLRSQGWLMSKDAMGIELRIEIVGRFERIAKLEAALLDDPRVLALRRI